MPTLYVYTARHCLGCEEARRLAGTIARRFPDLKVEVVDLDEPGSAAPSQVFAVPTYLLAGRVLSLGNPAEEDLAERLREVLRRGEPATKAIKREG